MWLKGLYLDYYNKDVNELEFDINDWLKIRRVVPSDLETETFEPYIRSIRRLNLKTTFTLFRRAL